MSTWDEEEARLAAIADPETAGEFERITRGRPSIAPPPDAELVAFIAREFGVDAVAAIPLAERVEKACTDERVKSIAHRKVLEDRAARDADLGRVDVVRADELLARQRPPRRGVLGDLLLEGQNATLTGAFKVGKSTVVENAIAAAVSGGLFLGRFPASAPMNVVVLNYELPEEDMDTRVRRMGLADEELRRLRVVNLRGHRLPLMARAGRDWLVELLLEHEARFVVVDPYGAAYGAAGGVRENDNGEVRSFLLALDEIKRLGACPTLLMPVHTGRGFQVEGDERARGAAVLDDWTDVRFVLTKNDKGGRFLRSEGRAFELSESRLSFDAGRLTLAAGDVGLGRQLARSEAHVDAVVELVEASPGINKATLRTSFGAHGEGDDAIKLAIDRRLVHVHPGPRRAQLHHPGENCPEGCEA